MSNSKGSGGGCLTLFAGLFLIALAVWTFAIALWVLGLVIVVGGVVGSLALAVWGWLQVRRRGEITKIEAEISAMAGDCCADLSALQTELMALTATKGIGTPLETELQESNRLVDQLYVECENAIRMCQTAPATAQRIEAIVHAEQVRSQVSQRIRQA
ncbi:hypothetical protein [Corynebacterium sp. H78]|uniref:hypothetical protein n=1 Tax=Corynebacterium sp. H78 TaxID=3133417 RepID=UPI00309C7DB3